MFFIKNVCLFVSFAFDVEDEGDGLEGEVGDVADAEGKDEGARLGNVGECPGAEDDEMEKEGADGDPEEVLDEGARVFVETFYDNIVLESGDDCKVEWYDRHDGLEYALCEP